MDFPRGTLQLTTLRKLPMHRPKRPAKIVKMPSVLMSESLSMSIMVVLPFDRGV